ncbi:hypothetical protein KAFR_0C05640 [Kazachstania africana CBS 2517]|uniref:Nucleoporin NDC1 n=1 Tax=Kazachstania africana (strain ATCC 22294 / BCRC 22015 / CBS 2517 / CECT 1963 / NBRC 1671 / NRRL Y-8276) TaxID=1071382 RepID=H2AT55_KAZAF|nr:hypothetical protein KAFR_0C05640 [Kazachstania africana CBS 2517]CCF57555.1 hypothetical protein KAFR_0C05640 [Kazachstania africana CBS 2517]
MLETPTISNSKHSYNVIFSDICKTRFNHMVTRLFLTTSVLQSVIITLLSKGNSSALELLLMFLPKVLLVYSVSIFMIITRKNYLHIDSLGYTSLFTQIIGQILSVRFFVYETLYSFCSFLVAFVVSDCFGMSAISQEYAEFYRIYVWIAIPTIYTLQHVIFDLDKLFFSLDSQYQPPQTYIATNLSKGVMKCLILSLLLIFISPFIFGFLTTTWFIGIFPLLKLSMLAFCIFINFEFINVAFTAHMSIGCLHKGKPISALSSTPIETLITGLSSKKPFTKLTAFQELSYRATSSDPSLRLLIYNNPYRNVNIWKSILRECLSVIQESNDAVNNYLRTLQKSMETTSSLEKAKKVNYNPAADNEGLFGNEPITISTNNVTHIPGSAPQSNYDTSSGSVSHKISLREENVLLKRNRFKHDNTPGLTDHYHTYNESLITHDTKLFAFVRELFNKLKNSITSFFFPSTVDAKDQISSLSIFEAWYLSKSRQAERLVPLSIIHAESIVSLMGFLINAIDESPKGSVVASVGEVLKYLERSVAILGKFNEWNPDGKSTANSLNVISILYESSISAFLEIVLKYNVLLNEVYLDEDVIKLSKWVLDMCSNEDPVN